METTVWKRLEYSRAVTDEVLQRYIDKHKLNETLDEHKRFFGTLDTKEARLDYAAWLAYNVIDRDVVCVHYDEVDFESTHEGSGWVYRYEHGFNTPSRVYGVLLDLCVDSNIDFDVKLVSGSNNYPDIDLYSGQSFRMSMLPLEYLKTYSLVIRSAAPFTLKCKPAQIAMAKHSTLISADEPIVLAVNGKPSWMLNCVPKMFQCLQRVPDEDARETKRPRLAHDEN